MLDIYVDMQMLLTKVWDIFSQLLRLNWNGSNKPRRRKRYKLTFKVWTFLRIFAFWSLFLQSNGTLLFVNFDALIVQVQQELAELEQQIQEAVLSTSKQKNHFLPFVLLWCHWHLSSDVFVHDV